MSRKENSTFDLSSICTDGNTGPSTVFDVGCIGSMSPDSIAFQSVDGNFGCVTGIVISGQRCCDAVFSFNNFQYMIPRNKTTNDRQPREFDDCAVTILPPVMPTSTPLSPTSTPASPSNELDECVVCSNTVCEIIDGCDNISTTVKVNTTNHLVIDKQVLIKGDLVNNGNITVFLQDFMNKEITVEGDFINTGILEFASGINSGHLNVGGDFINNGTVKVQIEGNTNSKVTVYGCGFLGDYFVDVSTANIDRFSIIESTCTDGAPSIVGENECTSASTEKNGKILQVVVIDKCIDSTFNVYAAIGVVVGVVVVVQLLLVVIFIIWCKR